MLSCLNLMERTHAFRHMRAIRIRRWTEKKNFKRAEICEINKKEIKYILGSFKPTETEQWGQNGKDRKLRNLLTRLNEKWRDFSFSFNFLLLHNTQLIFPLLSIKLQFIILLLTLGWPEPDPSKSKTLSLDQVLIKM